jgi:hypothetical protein
MSYLGQSRVRHQSSPHPNGVHTSLSIELVLVVPSAYIVTVIDVVRIIVRVMGVYGIPMPVVQDVEGQKGTFCFFNNSERLNTDSLIVCYKVEWLGGPGRLPAQGSHRSVLGRIRPYGSSSNPFASPTT